MDDGAKSSDEGITVIERRPPALIRGETATGQQVPHSRPPPCLTRGGAT